MDPNQMQHFNGVFAGMMGIFVLIALAVFVFMVFLFWRIFTKAGLPGPLALLLVFGPIGMLINVCILAFADWKVAPVARQRRTIRPTIHRRRRSSPDLIALQQLYSAFVAGPRGRPPRLRLLASYTE